MATNNTPQTSGGPADGRVTKKEEAAYFQQAAGWDNDRVLELMKSRRTAWIVASVAAGVSAVLAIGYVVLLPLKTVEYSLVRVDSSTGIVDQVVKLKDAQASYDELMTKFFLRRVVILRETYTRGQLQSNYDQSVLFTAPQARKKLNADFSFENPDGPSKRYGELGTASVQFVNISFLAKNIAQVRFIRTDTKGGSEFNTRWTATVEYRYVSQPASEDARGINPLGFQVTNYRLDPEADVGGAKP